MTTFAPNFTPRYKARYHVGGIDHTVQVRGPRGATAADMESKGHLLHDAWNAFAAGTYSDFAWLSAEYALTDSDVFIPITTPSAVTGAIDPADFSAVERIKGLTFSGRAPGSRARFTMYGLAFTDTVPGDFAATGVLLGIDVAAVGTVATLASSNWYANSGSQAIYPARATYKENDHLLKLVRKGTIT